VAHELFVVGVYCECLLRTDGSLPDNVVEFASEGLEVRCFVFLLGIMNVVGVMESDTVDNMLIRNAVTALGRDKKIGIMIKGKVIVRQLVLEARFPTLASCRRVLQMNGNMSMLNVNIDGRVLEKGSATLRLLYDKFLISNFGENTVFSRRSTF